MLRCAFIVLAKMWQTHKNGREDAFLKGSGLDSGTGRRIVAQRIVQQPGELT